MKALKFYDFGEFRLDAGERQLIRCGEFVPLTPKEFDVLFFLVERAGRIVEKGELLDAIWADTFVEETTLARNISWLRKKLGDGAAGDAKFIETVPKRGYRFAAAVTAIEENNALAAVEGNALVVEEQTLQHFLVEETVTLAPEFDSLQNLPPAPAELQLNPKSEIRNPKLLWLAFGVFAIGAIGFILYQNFFRRAEQKIVSVAKVVPFSGLPGREDMPAFSPDGKLIAFVWNGGNDEDLNVYIKQIGAGEPVRLTKNEADEISPTFSSDGRQIAFVRVLPTRSELLLIPALGGAERKVCDLRRNTSSISFSPDGRFIAVHDGDENGERPGIFLVDVENGGKRRLTAPPEQTADDRPAFAPNGRSILFIRSFGDLLQEIFIVSAAGDEPRQLTSDKSWIGGAAWTADGQKIVFVSLRKYNNQRNIWQIGATGSDAPKLIATGGKRMANPAISADGRIVAFVEESSDTNIWRIEPELFPARRVARKFAPSSFNDNSPNVAPDGSRVIFASNRTGNYEIWIADADGSNARQVTDLKTSPAGSPRFSPDGKWVAFDAQISGNGDIFIVSADGGTPHRLTDSPSFDYMPAWSADGAFVYFASKRSGAAQIYKMPAIGGDARQITENGGQESYESFDGKRLYYSKGGGSTGLWSVSSEGGGDEQSIPELAETCACRYWTLTKTGIYFVRRSNYPPYKIMFYDFAADRTNEAATVDAFPIWVYPGLGASADGKTIYYTQSELNASSIMLAELEK